MNFFCKTLFIKIANKHYFNNAYLINNNKLSRLMNCFSPYSLLVRICKPLKVSSNRQISSLSKARSFSSGSIYDLKKKLNSFIFKLFLKEKTRQVNLATNWYATLQTVNYKEFFSILEMPDTFYSWFQVTQLHVWMILVRLQQEKTPPLKVKSILIKMMWDDVEIRAKIHAPFNKNFRKNMSQLYHEFRLGLFALDEGFLMDDKILASSVWYYFFKKDCDDPRKLEAVVSFIRYQIDQLQSKNIEDVIKESAPAKVWISLSQHLKKKQM